jgi:penicillin-binding protein 1A
MGLFDQQPRRTSEPYARKPARGRSWEFRLFILLPMYLTALSGLAVAGAFVYFTATIPDPMVLRHKERAPLVRLLARDGSVLAERGGAAPYIPVDLLPRHLVDAVLAIEDRRFFSHRGIDPSGFSRALLTNLRAGRFVQGGSTITQQLAKNMFLTPERTLWRKAEELILALWLEMRLSKPEILELYLNRVYFGSGAYGVESAARRFFDKGAQEVTLAEAAVLAGLLKAPSKYSPAWNPALTRARAQEVLTTMVEAGFATPIDGALNAIKDVQFAPAKVMRGETGVEFAVDAVLDRLPRLTAAGGGEIIVETTIDANLQRRAQQLVHDIIASEGRKMDATQAALVVLDTQGGIAVMVGGESWGESQFNRALRAKRQPGSAYKPFVYLVALEHGMTPDTVVPDTPIVAKGWTPGNFDGKYRGAVTLREALARSINTVAIRLNMNLGPRKSAEAGHRLGIKSELRPDATLALGTSEVTLTELTGAYGAFATGGRLIEPHVIKRVSTSSGRVLYQRPEEKLTVVAAQQHVGALNDMLNAALISGTGKRAALPVHPACGKTGTTQDFRDAWFVGYTAHYVGGVWVGNDDRRPMNNVMGGGLPSKLWHEVMVLAHAGKTPKALPGTVPAAPLAGPSGGQAKATQGREPTSSPAERIDEDFVRRAVQRGGGTERRWASGPAE